MVAGASILVGGGGSQNLSPSEIKFLAALGGGRGGMGGGSPLGNLANKALGNSQRQALMASIIARRQYRQYLLLLRRLRLLRELSLQRLAERDTCLDDPIRDEIILPYEGE